MNKNLIGLDIGTGSVKVATASGTFSFPSIIARGKSIDIEAKEIVLVGNDALKAEYVKSMAIRTPVYRGAPTSMDDYLDLIRHALDHIINSKDAISVHYSDLVIMAGIPYNAKERVGKIKEAVIESFGPKFFGVMFQAKATLDHMALQDGIVCHIGHGTTEIMAVSHGKIAYGQTLMHGVGDITNAICSSKTQYVDNEIFLKNTPELANSRKILAANISDSLEKVVIDYPHLKIVFAGGGALVPRLVSEIKNGIIKDVIIAENPVFSNALGMLKRAEKCI
jgi:actin-like ATPase involved in cell morphogenesis